MKTTSWVSVAVVCAAVAGAGGQNPTPAPPPREKPTDEAWLPKVGSDPHPGRKSTWVGPDGTQTKIMKIAGLALDPPTAFPDLAFPDIPGRAEEDYEKRRATFEKLCPRLHGTIALKIEPADGTLRKLLKARLHQGVLGFQAIQRSLREPIAGPGMPEIYYHNCLLDIQSAATELWAGEPKELVPWLEELVITFKRIEQYTRWRVENGTVPLTELHTASRLRLKMEAELWKAKNPK